MNEVLEQFYNNKVNVDICGEDIDDSVIINLEKILHREHSEENIQTLLENLNDIEKCFSAFVGLSFGNIKQYYDYSEIDNEFKFNLLSHLFIGHMVLKLKKDSDISHSEAVNKIQNLINIIKGFVIEKEPPKQSLYDTIIKKSESNVIGIEKKDTVTGVFKRDIQLVEFLKEYFEYKCIICHKNIKRDDNKPYIESHHVQPLSEGGSDTADNIIIVCPNCHKIFHFGRKTKRDKMEKLLKTKNPFKICK
ncbi:MAG: HNH endonuclease [Nanoarchaeota archaeon]|nr:HNH endonuclease [Nanoarchaeota archaeon]